MITFKGCGLIATFTGITSLAYSYAGNKTDEKSPNVIIITCHDLGQHLGCYGVPSVNSPHIDNLASKGVMFNNFYSTSAVCSPGRASLFTGRYPQSNGMLGLIHAPWWWQLNDGEKHLAHLLKEMGYETTLIGFTHIGEPKSLGFDTHLSVKRNAEESVKEAIEFFSAKSMESNPFFLKIGFTEVHSPYKNGADSTDGVFIPGYLQGTKEIRSELAKFQASIQYLDQCVGKIIESLENSEVSENTIVIFTSDHGIGFPGAKWSGRKAGLEVPFIIYQPNSIFSGGKVFNEVMSNVDVVPTILKYLGHHVPANVEGISFKEFIAGENKKSPRETAFGQYTADMKRDNESRTVITRKYQLIWYFCAGRTIDLPLDADPSAFAQHTGREKTLGTRPFFELFDIEKDPWELSNLSGLNEYDDVAADLAKKLITWMTEVDDPLLKGPVVTPYFQRSIEELTNLKK